MKIMLIGSADLSGQRIGGQYEKTRLLYEFLKREDGIQLYFCNMFEVGRSVRLLFSVIKGYIKNDYVIIVTSSRGTKVLSEVMYWLKKLKNNVVIYLIVGNQQKLLQSFTDKKMKTIDKIYLEMNIMQKALEGRVNVGVFSNGKDMHPIEVSHSLEKPLSICYYSEISYRKGFDRLVRALDDLNKNDIKYNLDVFGYFGNDKSEMEKFLEGRNYVRFRGAVKKDRSREVLPQYFMLVFPSRHRLEGVPGAIVDAYEAGLPVLCSNVGLLSYVVKENETGYLFHSDNELKNSLAAIFEKPDMIEKMRKNCFNEAKKYDIKKSVKMLYNDMINMKN